MAHDKKKFSSSRDASKKGSPLGLVIAVAGAVGIVIGSAGTYYFSSPSGTAKQSPSPTAAATPQPQTVTMTPQGFTPGPQPPGEVPPGKVWSPEHGHWHDAPGVVTTPVPGTTTPAAVTATPAPSPSTPIPFVTPAPPA